MLEPPSFGSERVLVLQVGQAVWQCLGRGTPWMERFVAEVLSSSVEGTGARAGTAAHGAFLVTDNHVPWSESLLCASLLSANWGTL